MNAKRMTDEEAAAADAAVTAAGWTDKDGKTIASRIRADWLRARAAESFVPEDVARERKAVISAADALMTAGTPELQASWSSKLVTAVDALATAAARVPGLVAELADEQEKARGAGENHVKALEYCAEVTAERDAARQEVAAQKNHITRLSSEVLGLRIARDEAKNEYEAARDERDEAQSRLKDAEAVNINRMHDALTARVAELELEVSAAYEREGAIHYKADAAEARATAAEQNARDLSKRCEDLATQCRAAEQRVSDLTETLERKQMAIHGLMETAAEDAQPGPTPAPSGTGPRITAMERLVDVARRLASGANNRMVWDDLDAALAAYDAVKGEPSVTHAQLAAVVEEYAQEKDEEATEAEAKDLKIAATSARGCAEGAREVLRRVTGGEVPQVLPKTRVVEVLERYAMGRQIARDLGLTLPTIPGGGETWCGCETDMVDDSGHCEKHGNDNTPRARIAPTPKPEEPALAPVPGFPMPPPGVLAAIQQQAQPEPAAPEVEKRGCFPGDHVWWDGGDLCACRATRRYTAPEVCWEAPGSVRVVGPVGEERAEVKGKDGEWYEANVGGWAYVLARALAEAKRENARLKPKPVREMYSCKACGRRLLDAVPCEEHPMMPVVSSLPDANTLVSWLDHEQREAKALHSALKASNERWQKAEAAIQAIHALPLEDK